MRAGAAHRIRSIATTTARWWKNARYHVGEVRTFRRFPRHLRLDPAEGPGLRDVLYGIPYGDWNGMLSNATFWRAMRVVSEVRRIPAFRLLLPSPDDRTVLIPMKTGHAIAAPTRAAAH